MRNYRNPFIHNYVFSKADLNRVPINKWKGFFLKTYVQINDGYVFYYKQRDNTYYFVKAEKLPDVGISERCNRRKV